ncbi:triphosphoribosyl-dephospho-CoA synthase [Lutibacter sp. A80]|uniref:triphosphoribosyl-dephospho-CoA synthase n=1 Tax=Lutibacter sp. A80 TaxID=2918453 RepID=UPI001F068DA4|nr:triphosphoribosyl-dephospho-CoA synthase [Lutibacter sp. A80]UMB59550.1 triphosphoribosyl-dephospho-CoA synthase [Lutibacter sp. A80]
MVNSQKILEKILNARENRAQQRAQFLKQQFNTLSLSLNIPGYPKSNELISTFFLEVKNNLINYLQANRVELIYEKETLIVDEAGDFFIIPIAKNSKINVLELKILTENFESTQTLGRLIDVDIFNDLGVPISSGKKKLCYFCGKHAAISCMRNKRHTKEEIRNLIFNDLKKIQAISIKNKRINTLVAFASKAILYEISLSPKPGLVSFKDTGSHTDMHFFTFLNSAVALTPFFNKFCELGYAYTGKIEEILPKIRHIGIKAEQEMFKATGNVNTHKGIIFLFGISLFSIAKIISENNRFSDTTFKYLVIEISNGIVKNELELNSKKVATHGELMYKKYGKLGAGIRQEVAEGFPSVFKNALPFLDKNFKNHQKLNQEEIQEILQTTLLHIISLNNDSNILYRSNFEALTHVKKLAKNAIHSKKSYIELCNYCKENNISPGGSADLLSVSLLIHFVKNAQL